MMKSLGDFCLHVRILVQALIAPVAFAVGGAVFDKNNRVLLVRHTYKPGWQFPLGGVNRGEYAEAAVMREMREEVALLKGTPSLFSIYTRTGGVATNVIAFYCIRDIEISFHPNLEITEITFADLNAPPEDCTDDTIRRIGELAGTAKPAPYW